MALALGGRNLWSVSMPVCMQAEGGRREGGSHSSDRGLEPLTIVGDPRNSCVSRWKAGGNAGAAERADCDSPVHAASGVGACSPVRDRRWCEPDGEVLVPLFFLLVEIAA